MILMNLLVAGGVLALLIVAAVAAIGVTAFTAVSVNKINKRQAELKANQADNPVEEAQEEAKPEEAQEEPQEQPADEAVEPPVEEKPEEESQPEEEQPAQEEAPQEEPAQEEQPEEQPQPAPVPVVAAEAQEESPDEDKEEIVAQVNEETGELEFFAYNRSFTSRVIQANDETQSRYERIKNHLLSFKGVKSRVSWGYDAFRKGREAIATILIKGKTLNVYLALDPKEYEDTKYRFEDASEVKKYADVPMRLRVKNNLNEKYAMELIDILMEKMGLELGAEQNENYHRDYETDEQLLNEDLIRLMRTDRKPVNMAEVKVLKKVKTEDGEELIVLDSAVDSEGNEVIQAQDSHGNIVEYYYNRSFEAKLIQASEQNKSFYQIIKNHILAYKGENDRMSWNYETFRTGRKLLVMLVIKGKTLNVYLALNPKEFENSKYRYEDASSVKKYEDVPMRVKVRNFLNLKYACELIDILMDMNGCDYPGEDPDVDYHRDYEPIEPLVDRKLAKLVKRNGASLFTNKPTETPVEEVKEEPAPAPVVEEPEEEAEEEKEEIVTIVNAETGELEFFSYNRSFTSRVIQASEETQSRYERIKNHILSYKDVKSRVSWGYDAFRKGRQAIATILIKGKTLNVYLALDPKEYEDTKYRFEDASEVKKYADVPMRLRVKNDLNEKYAIELIDILMEKLAIAMGAEQNENYHKDYETDEQLLKEDLIRLVKTNRPSSFAKEAPAEEVTPIEEASYTEAPVEEAQPEEQPAEEPVEETPEEEAPQEEKAPQEEPQPEEEQPAEETQPEEEPQEEEPAPVEEHHAAHTLEELEEVQKEEVTVEEAEELVSDELVEEETETVYQDVQGKKKGVINIDTISDCFNNGDVITLELLKEKGLLPAKCDSYKVLARGTLSKKLTVIANDFSSNAAKMILVTGGTVKKIKKQ